MVGSVSSLSREESPIFVRGIRVPLKSPEWSQRVIEDDDEIANSPIPVMNKPQTGRASLRNKHIEYKIEHKRVHEVSIAECHKPQLTNGMLVNKADLIWQADISVSETVRLQVLGLTATLSLDA